MITGATIHSPTVRTSRWRRLRLQNTTHNQDCSPPHWMVGYNAKRRKDEVRIGTFDSHSSFASRLRCESFWPEPKIPATPLITTFRLLPEMARPMITE